MLSILLSYRHFKHIIYVSVVALVIAGVLFAPRLASSPPVVVENEVDSLFVPEVISEVRIGETVFFVEVADTPASRTQGLSGREALSEKEGLLFVFEEPGLYAFWMKDMLFDIDIAWIAKDGRIVYIKDRATPETFPETFKPSEKALYVLEVNAGMFEKEGIGVGDIVSFK